MLMYVTYFICILIFLAPYLLKRSNDQGSISSSVTTFGILGTFAGILIGLMNFDVNNIQAAVPELLDGLRTAFLTSIVGIIASLITKHLPQFYGITPIKENEEAGPVQAMLIVLNKISDSQEKLLQTFIDSSSKTNLFLSRIENNLGDANDSSILTQLQKLRLSMTDSLKDLEASTKSYFNELIIEIRSFAQIVADNSMQAIIAALKEVISDFNNKLSEQLGENFKHLNTGVKRLVIWQRQHKEHVEFQTQQMEKVIDAIDAIDGSLQDIIDKSGNIVEIANQIDAIVRDLEPVLLTSQEMVDAFIETSEQAKAVIPALHENLNSLTDELSSTVESVSAAMAKSVSDSAALQSNTVNKVSGEIHKLVSETSNMIAQQLKQIDSQLGEELTKSLNALGNQLAALSNKFVEDYSPLTDQLRQVVLLASDIRETRTPKSGKK